MANTVVPQGMPRKGVGVGVRAAARGVDVGIVVVVDLALGAGMGFGFDWLIVGALVVYGYFAGSTATGGTPGKRALGLRVEGSAGGAPTPGEAAWREAFTLVGAIPLVGPALAMAAWVAIAWTAHHDPEGRGVHDRLAGGTRVVHV